MSTAIRHRKNTKAIRRPTDSWLAHRVQQDSIRTPKKGIAAEDRTKFVRFPATQLQQVALAATEAVPITRRLESVQSAWSAAEREFRRMHAIRKQEELLWLLAGEDMADFMRLAIAEGEQPVVPPECEWLLN